MKKMSLSFLIVVCVSFMTASAFAATAAKVIAVTNNGAQSYVEGPMTALDVIEMSCAGLNDSVIISKMDASGAAFDLSVADIIELKKAGVNDPVINYMINSKNVPAGKAVVSSIPAAAPVVEYVQPAPAVVVPQTTCIVQEPVVSPVRLNFSFGYISRGPCRPIPWVPHRGGWWHGGGPRPHR